MPCGLWDRFPTGLIPSSATYHWKCSLNHTEPSGAPYCKFTKIYRSQNMAQLFFPQIQQHTNSKNKGKPNTQAFLKFVQYEGDDKLTIFTKSQREETPGQPLMSRPPSSSFIFLCDYLIKGTVVCKLRSQISVLEFHCDKTLNYSVILLNFCFPIGDHFE